jgi:HEAT repeat protein
MDWGDTYPKAVVFTLKVCLSDIMGKLGIGLILVFAFPLAAPGQTFLGKDTAAWEKILNDSQDARQRRNAAFALGKLGSGAEPALPSLKKHLKGDDARVREAAAVALGEIGKDSPKAKDDPTLVEALGDALKDDEPLVRRSAAQALGNFGKAAKPALAVLQTTLVKETSPAVRQNIAWALGRIGPESIASLTAALRDPDPIVQREAANSIGFFKDEIARKALPELLACCKVKNSGVRNAALNVLINILEEADTEAAASIAEALADSDREVRQNAALALSAIGGKVALPAIPILVDTLKQKGNKEVRQQAAIALYNIGPDAHEAIPALIQALADDDSELRSNAALALGGIGPRAEPAVPHLVNVLANSKETRATRVEAAKALARIGPVPAAVDAIPKLVKVLEDKTTETIIRERAIWALRPHYANRATVPELPGVFPAFSKILSEPKTQETRMLRYDCAYMLGVLQRKNAPEEALDTLLEFLHDKTILIYRGTSGKPGGIKELPKEPPKVLESGNGDGRIMAIQALMRIGFDRVGKRDDIMKQLKAIAADPKTLPDLFVRTIAAFRAFGVDSGVPQAAVTARLKAIVANKKTDEALRMEAEKLLR